MATPQPDYRLSPGFQNIVEVYCDCAVETAAIRFHNRKRHRGHGDGRKPLDETELWLEGFSGWYPLNIGPVINVATDQDPELYAIIKKIKSAL